MTAPHIQHFDSLEQQWHKAFKASKFDTQDEIEEKISKLTGETVLQVNKRLANKFLKD